MPPGLSNQQVQTVKALKTDFATANPILALGELGIETDTGQFKIGNGTTRWNDLRYAANAVPTDANFVAAFLQRANNLSDLGSASTARTNLGLGTAAVMSPSTISSDDALRTGYEMNASRTVNNTLWTVPRHSQIGSYVAVSGRIALAGFTAPITETFASLRSVTAGNGFSALTIGKMGLYSIDAAGNATLVANTANDTGLWASTWTIYTRALTSPYQVIKNNRYAIGLIAVGTTGSWSSSAQNWTGGSTGAGELPWLSGLGGVTADLPASIAFASITSGSLGIMTTALVR